MITRTLCFSRGEDHAEHAIVGRDEVLARGFGQDRAARGAHARIDHDHVHGLLREVAIRLRDQERGLGDFVGAHLVADVHDARGGRNPRMTPFMTPDVVVGESEIGGQGDDGPLLEYRKVQHFYFDHNATTPVSPEVLEAMVPCLDQVYGNASSIHHFGQIAKQRLERRAGRWRRC